MKKLILLLSVLFLLASCNNDEEDMYKVSIHWTGHPDCNEFATEEYEIFGNQLSTFKSTYCNNKCSDCTITKL